MKYRPTILIDTLEFEVVDEALEAFRHLPNVYRLGDTLVEIAFGSGAGAVDSASDQVDATPRLLTLTKPRVRELLTQCATWQRLNKEYEYVPAHPPPWVVKELVARQQWPNLRPLLGIIEHATLRPDGTILAKAGYDGATALYVSTPAVEGLVAEPSRDDARRAAYRLLELVEDFPFAKTSGKSAWLAGLLAVVARPAFRGPAPMLVFDANTAGTGKSRLADLISVITTGRSMPRQPPSGDENEQRKVITSIVRAGHAVLLIDNVDGTLGGPSLDAALTSEIWQDRLLGGNTTIRLPMRVLFFATGNNITLAGDLQRRCLYVRLETSHEHPEARDDFRHPELLAFAGKQRAHLLGDALTLLRAYFVAGCPPHPSMRPFGSFEDWSAKIRAALVWVGLPDPCATTADIPSAREREATALDVIMSRLTKLGGTTASRLLEWAEIDEGLREAMIELVPPPGGQRLPNAGSLGVKLHHLRGRVRGGRKIDRVGAASPVRWIALAAVDAPASGASGASGVSAPADVAGEESPTSPDGPAPRPSEQSDAYERDERVAIESENESHNQNGAAKWNTL